MVSGRGKGTRGRTKERGKGRKEMGRIRKGEGKGEMGEESKGEEESRRKFERKGKAGLDKEAGS